MSSTWGVVGLVPESSARVAVSTADFAAATHRLYHEPQRASYLDVKVLP